MGNYIQLREQRRLLATKGRISGARDNDNSGPIDARKGDGSRGHMLNGARSVAPTTTQIVCDCRRDIVEAAGDNHYPRNNAPSRDSAGHSLPSYLASIEGFEGAPVNVFFIHFFFPVPRALFCTFHYSFSHFHRME